MEKWLQRELGQACPDDVVVGTRLQPLRPNSRCHHFGLRSHLKWPLNALRSVYPQRPWVCDRLAQRTCLQVGGAPDHTRFLPPSWPAVNPPSSCSRAAPSKHLNGRVHPSSHSSSNRRHHGVFGRSVYRAARDAPLLERNLRLIPAFSPAVFMARQQSQPCSDRRNANS